MQRLLGETEFSSPSQAEAILQKLSDKDAANKRVKEYDDTLVSLRANMELLLKDGEIRPVSEEEYTKRSAEFAALTEKTVCGGISRGMRTEINRGGTAP